MLQNLPYFMYKKTHVAFFAFHLEHFLVFLMNALVYDYVDIDQGIHKVKTQKMLKMKNEKNYMGFLIHKIWQILKGFSRALS